MLVKSPLLHTSKQFSEFLFFYYSQVIFLHEVCVCVCVCICVHMYVCVYVYVYIHTSQMCVCICVCVCVCVCVCMYFPGVPRDWTWHHMLALRANARGVRDSGSIPGLGRFPGGGNGNPLQYSCWESPIDRGAWWATVHSIAKSWTLLKWLSMHAYICIYIYVYNLKWITIWSKI